MTRTESLEEFLDREFSLHERIVSYKKRRLYSLEIEITSACNGSCPYCYNSSVGVSKGRFLPKHTCYSLLESAASMCVKEIWWLGGEPMLCPWLFDAIRFAKTKGISKHIVFTNGLLLNDHSRCEQLVAEASHVVFHFDTIDPKHFAVLNSAHNRLDRRLMYDVHSKMRAGVNNLLAHKFPPGAIRHNITVTRAILESLQKTLKWGIETMKFSMATLIPVFSCGRGNRMPQEFYPSCKELHLAFQMRAQIERRPDLMRLGPSEYCKQYQLTTCYITVDGDILPYAGITIPCGNLEQEDFDRLFETHADTLLFRDIQSDELQNSLLGPCGSCPNGDICFGTRTVAYRNGKGLQGSDPSCWINL